MRSMKARENFRESVTISDPAAGANFSAAASVSSSRLSGTESNAGSFETPNFAPKSVYAVTSKVAGRLNATAVSAAEHQALLDERQKLLDRKFSGEFTRRDENRLAYVRWSLDRIEDAQYGPELDKLEEHISQYENLLGEITKFTAQLERHKRRGR
ncbi:hypothetical protein [Rhizobium rhizophilum]|uniref:Uncharacterized protein n=1 Tax=Rhizobium rhizophilum TaxID=1850373 RepID=A0ABY2QU63_9HYPH|nr:hypothetical protein [Rhizobium rhizophilum]THV13863.1 hypothetical protein E9677_13260 [Rhizobium rhizophilum]